MAQDLTQCMMHLLWLAGNMGTKYGHWLKSVWISWKNIMLRSVVVLTWRHCSQLLDVGCTHLITGKGVCNTPDEGVSQIVVLCYYNAVY